MSSRRRWPPDIDLGCRSHRPSSSSWSNSSCPRAGRPPRTCRRASRGRSPRRRPARCRRWSRSATRSRCSGGPARPRGPRRSRPPSRCPRSAAAGSSASAASWSCRRRSGRGSRRPRPRPRRGRRRRRRGPPSSSAPASSRRSGPARGRGSPSFSVSSYACGCACAAPPPLRPPPPAQNSSSLTPPTGPDRYPRGERPGILATVAKRWPGWVYDEGDEPDPRFSFANERTFLAWVRTALGLLADRGGPAGAARRHRAHPAQVARRALHRPGSRAPVPWAGRGGPARSARCGGTSGCPARHDGRPGRRRRRRRAGPAVRHRRALSGSMTATPRDPGSPARAHRARLAAVRAGAGRGHDRRRPAHLQHGRPRRAARRRPRTGARGGDLRDGAPALPDPHRRLEANGLADGRPRRPAQPSGGRAQRAGDAGRLRS